MEKPDALLYERHPQLLRRFKHRLVHLAARGRGDILDARPARA